MDLETEKKTDTREFLREIVRSNGALGGFWRRHDQLGAKVRSPTAGQVMISVDPLAFGGKGCISAIENPVHIGPPFGWSPITFAEWARRIRSGPADKLRIFGRRCAYELRFFGLPWEDAPPKKIFDTSFLLIGPEAPIAAFEVSRKTREYVETLMVEGHDTLAKSFRTRLDADDNTFGLDMIILYDLIGELVIFRGLFGNLLQEGTLQVHTQLMERIKSEVAALNDLMGKRHLDMFMTDLTSRMLDSYIVSLDHIYSKSDVFSMLVAPQMKGYFQQVYFGLQELRTMSENICAASVFLGHPPDLYRWITEFRNHDYALRELLERAYKVDWNSYLITEDRKLFFRDRFAYPPEIAWWMWFSLEKETGLPLDSVFAFDAKDVRKRTGLRVTTEKELPTPAPMDALVGKDVELMVIRSENYHPIVGLHLPSLRVDSVQSLGSSEGSYFLSKPTEGSEPIILNTERGPYRVVGVRFGNCLPRSAPQTITDIPTSRSMRSNPYKRIIVEASIDVRKVNQAEPTGPAPERAQGAAEEEDDDDDAGTISGVYALLASYEPGQPSAFEIQRYKLLEKYLSEIKAEREARDMDYAR